MTEKNNVRLIETMSSLMLISSQARQGGILTIVPIVDQVKESFLQKSLQMAIDGYDPESIKETLNTEIDSTNAYKRLVVEGVCMLASNETTEVMEERFKTYLSAEDQAKLDVRAKDLLEDWKERCQRGEVVF